MTISIFLFLTDALKNKLECLSLISPFSQLLFVQAMLRLTGEIRYSLFADNVEDKFDKIVTWLMMISILFICHWCLEL